MKLYGINLKEQGYGILEHLILWNVWMSAFELKENPLEKKNINALTYSKYNF